MPSKLRTGILLICLAPAAWSAGRLRSDAMGHYLSTRPYEDIYYVPPPGWLPAISLGYREALADLLWMKALIYFGEELTHRGEVRHIFDYADAMLALDKYFKPVYHWVATCSLYRTGTVTVEDVKTAISYLEIGARLFPDDGLMAWDLGATYAFELVPLLKDPREKIKAKRMGYEQLQFAVLRGFAPPWLVLTNASQLIKLGHTDQAIRHLEEAYDSVTDPAIKRQIEYRLKVLRSEAFAEAFKYAVRDFEQARERDFPYLSAGLYWMLGPRPPFDGIKLLLNDFDPLSDSATEETF